MTDCKTKDCGCESSLTTPQPCVNIFDCPSDNCAETFDSKCVIYSDTPVLCETDEVVSQGDTVEEAIQKIVAYFCNASSPVINNVVVTAGSGISVEETVVGNTTTYEVSLESINKVIEYYQSTTSVLVSSSPTPSVYNFPAPSYQTLKYTNTDTSFKLFKVHGSYETIPVPFSINGQAIENWVDGAIVKTVSGVDTVLYESLGTTALSGFLLDGSTVNNVISIATTDKVLTVAGDPVEFRFLNGSLPRNVSVF